MARQVFFIMLAGLIGIFSIGLCAADSSTIHETVTPKFQQALPNAPGKSLKVVIVDYPPGAKSVPHHHARSAFIYAQVLSGAIRSQVDDEPVHVYRTGEFWYENPGAHHKVGENASNTEPAQLLAVFVVDTGEEQLTVPDK